MIDLAQLKDQITNKLSGITSLIDLEETKSYFLGKKGLITVAFKNLGSVEASERKLQASELNIIKNDLIDRLRFSSTLVLTVETNVSNFLISF